MPRMSESSLFTAVEVLVEGEASTDLAVELESHVSCYS